MFVSTKVIINATAWVAQWLRMRKTGLVTRQDSATMVCVREGSPSAKCEGCWMSLLSSTVSSGPRISDPA